MSCDCKFGDQIPVQCILGLLSRVRKGEFGVSMVTDACCVVGTMTSVLSSYAPLYALTDGVTDGLVSTDDSTLEELCDTIETMVLEAEGINTEGELTYTGDQNEFVWLLAAVMRAVIRLFQEILQRM